jgi:hypothetical protein
MKYLLYVLAAAMLLTVAVPTQSADSVPAGTVRVIATSETDKVCSAVVIAPDYALTARHCLSAGMSVDGIVVDTFTASTANTRDIALLRAPGLRCPCAELGGRPAAGTRVVAVGFPGKLKGERRISEPASVNYIGSGTVLASWLVMPRVVESVFIFTDKPIIDHGDSGGGLFAEQGGRWVLIGINAIGLPAGPKDREKEQASGFTPVDLAASFLPKV